MALEAVDGVHEIWNLLSLEHNLHSKFDSLDLWFEGTDNVSHSEGLLSLELTECVYSPIATRSVFPARTSGSGFVPTLDVLRYPLLVPRSWSTCLRIAKVYHPLVASCLLFMLRALGSHTSGAAGFLDELELDAEETKVLAFDGSSAHLLSNLMSPYAAIHGVG